MTTTRDDDLLRELLALGQGCYLLIERRGERFVGVGRFAFTFGLMVGMTLDEPYERRYCFEQLSDALAAFAAHKGDDAHAIGPWIKVKGRLGSKWLDELGPGAFSS